MSVRLTYSITTDLDEAAIGAALGILSADERSRHDRLALARDRRDFAVARALLRRSLSEQGDRAPHEWTFTADPHGKPSLGREDSTRTRLAFNVSHTSGLVACAMARDVDIGVDVERLDRRSNALALATRFFSSREAASLARCEPAERQKRFIETWTLKEAFVKAIGSGLQCPLHEFSFTFGDPPELAFESTRRTRRALWWFALFEPSDGYRMAIAVGADSEEPPTLHVRDDPAGSRAAALAPLRVAITRTVGPTSPLDADRSTIGELPLAEHGRTTTFGA